jgi:serine/threonine-protein kinase RsbT
MYGAQNTTAIQSSDIKSVPFFNPDLFDVEEAFSTRTPIESIEDIVKARQKGRLLAQELGFSTSRSTLVTTVISELARNIVLYADAGEIILSRMEKGSVEGIRVIAADHGPGISNIQHALMGGVSTSGGLGLGLTGVKQLADEFEVTSSPGIGTTVIISIWRH